MTMGQKIKTQKPAHPPLFSTVADYKVKTVFLLTAAPED